MHLHPVYDTDAHFSIDADTRAITYLSDEILILIQGDHNSERFTFEIPRYIDGHDMMLCDLVRVSYINISADKNNVRNSGIYTIDDLQVHPEDEDILVCSWLISQNATLYAGSLNFVLHFACTSGSKIDYSWSTAVYSSVSVATSIDNTGLVVEQYADVLQTWYWELMSAGTTGVNMVDEATDAALAKIATAETDKIAGVEESAIASIEEAKTDAISSVKSTEQSILDNIVEAENNSISNVASTEEGVIERINASKTQALDDISTAESRSLVAISAAKTDGVNSIETLSSDSLASIETAKTEGVESISTLSSDALSSIEGAKTDAVNSIDALSSDSLTSIETAKSDGVTAISDSETSTLNKIKMAEEEALANITEAGTSDSAATLTAAKAYTDTEVAAAKAYTDTEIANLVGSSPELRNTLEELNTALAENEDVVEALNTAIATKANASDFSNVDNTADADKSVKYAASAGAVPWSGVTDRPDTFTPSSHTHTKAEVGLGNVDNTADADKSVKYAATAGSAPASDVYAWAKASTKPTYTKSEVGLGNVDNTADANKSVKYAATAGSATSATKATQDGNGNNIVNTYATKASLGTQVTYTVDGTTLYINTI